MSTLLVSKFAPVVTLVMWGYAVNLFNQSQRYWYFIFSIWNVIGVSRKEVEVFNPG